MPDRIGARLHVSERGQQNPGRLLSIKRFRARTPSTPDRRLPGRRTPRKDGGLGLGSRPFSEFSMNLAPTLPFGRVYERRPGSVYEFFHANRGQNVGATDILVRNGLPEADLGRLAATQACLRRNKVVCCKVTLFVAK